jgi:hypothetical protein
MTNAPLDEDEPTPEEKAFLREEERLLALIVEQENSLKGLSGLRLLWALLRTRGKAERELEKLWSRHPSSL